MSDQRTALVLGGGGITGIAWEIGVLAGLAEAGHRPDRRRPRRRHLGRVGGGRAADQRRGARGPVRPPAGAARRRSRSPGSTGRRWPSSAGRCCAAAGEDVEFRRRIGALALAAEKAGLTPSEQERLDVIGARLVSTEWPERPLVDHRRRRGDRRVPRRSTATPACRCCRPWRPAAPCPGVYPPVTIDGRRYVDGGMRSAANADLAAGYDRLVVLAPIPRGIGPMASVDAQVTGMVSRVAVVSPGRGQPDGDRPERARPGAPGRRRRRPAAPRRRLGRRAGRRGLDRLTGRSAAESGVAGADDRLRPVGDLQLREDVRHVVAHRLRAEHQGRRRARRCCARRRSGRAPRARARSAAGTRPRCRAGAVRRRTR